MRFLSFTKGYRKPLLTHVGLEVQSSC